MTSSFMGIETAKRSLFAHQTALQTTGQNISNADTVGYTRQRVNLVASQPMEAYGLMRSTVPGQLGQGVEFSSITRIREKFLDDQYMSENKTLGEWEVRDDTMQKLEAVLNEPSDTGIRTVLEKFWNAWQELSKNPEDSTARSLVKETGLALTDAFNHMGKQLGDLSSDITSNIGVKANEVNSTLQQISSLNLQISRIEGLGDNANDLRDQRDLLTDNLSKIVNIKVNEVSGGYEVTMGSEVLVTPGEEPAEIDSDFLENAYTSGELTGGEVYGMIYSRDVSVANFQAQLDTMVKGMVEGDIQVTLPAGTVIPDGTVIDSTTYSGTVADRTLSQDTVVTVKGLNGLHALGYAADGSSPPTTGTPFFTMKGDGEWSATNITINPDIVNNISLISSSLRTTQDTNGDEHVVPGNNTMALLLAGIQNAKLDFSALADSSSSSSGIGISGISNGTFSDFFQSMVSELGVQAQESSRQVANQTVLVQQVDSNRQSVSGVSLDEEMADMLKYQHAYNAAARLMTTVDEMLDKIINSTGVVGR